MQKHDISLTSWYEITTLLKFHISEHQHPQTFILYSQYF